MANIVYGDDPSCGIKKRVLHASRRELPEYPDGTRVSSFTISVNNCQIFLSVSCDLTGVVPLLQRAAVLRMCGRYC